MDRQEFPNEAAEVHVGFGLMVQSDGEAGAFPRSRQNIGLPMRKNCGEANAPPGSGIWQPS